MQRLSRSKNEYEKSFCSENNLLHFNTYLIIITPVDPLSLLGVEGWGGLGDEE